MTIQCGECDKSFKTKCNFKRHLDNVHKKIGGFPCPECNKIPKTKDALKNHIASVHIKEYKHFCNVDECDSKFYTRNKLVRHVRDVHGNISLPCTHENCNKVFSSQDQLTSHMKRHDKPGIPCSHCDKMFHCKSDLKSHVLFKHHEGPLPYKCDICGDDFACSGNLNRHMLVHNGKREHQCEECGKTYARSDDLKRHQLYEEDIRKFECPKDYCNERFHTKCHLKRHENVHRNLDITKKPQEKRLLKKLQEWGFNVALESHIKEKNGDCLDDTHRYFSRLDFHLLDSKNATIILECDEDQHRSSSYTQRCELGRMLDVHTSLKTSQFNGNVPIHWIRYSPTSSYMIGNYVKYGYQNRDKRENELKKYLDMIFEKVSTPDASISRRLNKPLPSLIISALTSSGVTPGMTISSPASD